MLELKESPAALYCRETYADARQLFLAQARRAGAALFEDPHPLTGPDGGALYLDIARLGPADASQVLVVGSATHGIEGYTGSAAQSHWLAAHDVGSLPPDTAVLLLHGHNPWGFAHGMRFTEENVDLNRNFVDFDAPPPANPLYAEVHALFNQGAWSDLALSRSFEQITAFRERVGEQAFSDAFNGGQYSHADGIFYGGARAQWSNQAFRRAIAAHLARARRVGLIDLHTGIGPPDGHAFLCFHAPDSAAYERARAWWGERAVNREGVNHKAVARYQGLLVDAFMELVAPREATAVVVEWGTRPREVMQRSQMAARWLWSAPADTPQALREQLMSDIREAFYPSDAEWRGRMLEQSFGVIENGLRGIAAGTVLRGE